MSEPRPIKPGIMLLNANNNKKIQMVDLKSNFRTRVNKKIGFSLLSIIKIFSYLRVDKKVNIETTENNTP